MPFTQEKQLALSAIKRAGILITFTQNVDVYDTTVQRVLHTPTNYQMWCAITKPIKRALGEDYAEDGSTVDYKQTLIAAAQGVTITPHLGDLLVLFGKKWTITDKDTVYPDGDAIIYKLSISRG